MKSVLGNVHRWFSDNGLNDIYSGVPVTLEPTALLTQNQYDQPSTAVYFENTFASIPEANYFGDEFSITFWIRPKNLDLVYAPIMTFGETGESNSPGSLLILLSHQNSNSIRFRINAADGSFCGQLKSTEQLVLDEWTFVGITYKDQVGSIYMNGSNKSSFTFTCGFSNMVRIDNYFGRRVTWPGNHYMDPYTDSILSDIRIFNRELSDDRIEDFYENSIQQLD